MNADCVCYRFATTDVGKAGSLQGGVVICQQDDYPEVARHWRKPAEQCKSGAKGQLRSAGVNGKDVPQDFVVTRM